MIKKEDPGCRAVSVRNGSWRYGEMTKKDGKYYVVTRHGQCSEVDSNTYSRPIYMEDRNGIQIYEHDMVRAYDMDGKKVIGEVVFNIDEKCYVLECEDGRWYFMGELHEKEIISNRYIRN